MLAEISTWFHAMTEANRVFEVLVSGAPLSVQFSEAWNAMF